MRLMYLATMFFGVVAVVITFLLALERIIV
jgi:hypothetical protein